MNIAALEVVFGRCVYAANTEKVGLQRVKSAAVYIFGKKLLHIF